MSTDLNLQFITEKIAVLRTAVMYSMSNSLVKLPNDIVNLVKIDDDGYLWFLAHLPSQSLSQCEREFPARLHFFRKGYDYYVEVSGKATIEDVIVEAGCKQVGNVDTRRTVLVKMTMPNIEYREPHARRDKSKIQLFMEKSYKWMLRNVGFPHTEGSVFGKIHQPH
jgi:hypothetical protein